MLVAEGYQIFLAHCRALGPRTVRALSDADRVLTLEGPPLDGGATYYPRGAASTESRWTLDAHIPYGDPPWSGGARFRG